MADGLALALAQAYVPAALLAIFSKKFPINFSDFFVQFLGIHALLRDETCKMSRGK